MTILPEELQADHGGPIPTEVVARFVASHEFPLLEPGMATFAWHGEAEHVDILRWIHGGVSRSAFEKQGDSRLWLLRLPVTDGGRFEYKLSIGRNGQEQWIIDPLNPATAEDPFGSNSVCRTFGYARPAWSRARGAPAGHMETLPVASPVFEETRQERVYLPAGHDPETFYPLLVIHDGNDFVTYADLAVSLDNLIADGDIPPLIAALTQTSDRMHEYPRGRRHARYLVRDLLPALESRYRLNPEPDRRVLLGASLGAVASLSTAFRYPGVFGGLVLQSGSFILDEQALEGRQHPVFQRVAQLMQVLRRAPDLPATRAFISAGELEGLAEENRALAGFLRERGVDVLFKSSWDGHHWHNWRDRLRDGLMWVYRRDDERT